jgi:hypothetical protein
VVFVVGTVDRAGWVVELAPGFVVPGAVGDGDPGAVEPGEAVVGTVVAATVIEVVARLVSPPRAVRRSTATKAPIPTTIATTMAAERLGRGPIAGWPGGGGGGPPERGGGVGGTGGAAVVTGSI